LNSPLGQKKRAEKQQQQATTACSKLVHARLHGSKETMLIWPRGEFDSKFPLNSPLSQKKRWRNNNSMFEARARKAAPFKRDHVNLAQGGVRFEISIELPPGPEKARGPTTLNLEARVHSQTHSHDILAQGQKKRAEEQQH
jgi:hypothetical protein